MLTKIYAPFSDERTAKVALTEFRKKYRVALRGAVVIHDAIDRAHYIHAPLGNTGFSNAEFASALRAGNY